MTTQDPAHPPPASVDDDEPQVRLTQALTWLGEGKRLIAIVTIATAGACIALSLALPKTFTAHATLLAPGSQQQGGAAAALSALGSLGVIGSGVAGKTSDELYVALLKSDSVQRALADRFDLMAHYGTTTYETLRKTLPQYIKIAADKKSGLITVDVDDADPTFAATLANAHATEVTKLLGRLAVSEAQLRRVFFEKQLNETKENLIRAEQNLRTVQEKSGVIVLDKQADALITSAAQVRAQIAEREVQLKVLRTSATEQNPDVMRLNSELRALRAELARMESPAAGATAGGPSAANSAIDLPIGKLPEAGIEYVRARRELKLQETLLEAMLRQFEAAKLDEAKEGVSLQVVDRAVPPDRKSKPSGVLITLGGTLAALLMSSAFVLLRGYRGWADAQFPERAAARAALARAWRWR